ncbi:MAG: CDP-alcohol phosphatidyltransferase family protein [Candidatus Krumholzibacteria bacterium]|nr:CDP-alcohol phosphatidyltransferase family protein [Candidatus Krumholzibacteria bacterium]
MFSIRAINNADITSRSPKNYLLFAKVCLGEAVENARVRRALSLSIARFCATSYIVALVPLIALYVPFDPVLSLRIALCGAIACIFLTLMLVLNVGLIRTENDTPEAMLGVANKLTIVRLVLVVPLVMLVLDGRFAIALAIYVICLLTDVFDGMVARQKRGRTEFGTIMDPVADIASTAGLFGAMMVKGLIPTWVFVILIVRYVTLFAGCAALFISIGPLKIRATPVGKIVGVLQGVAGIMILVLAASGLQWQDRYGVVIFPFLGLIFGSVIISQFVIGMRHLKRGVLGARSRGKSEGF